MNELGRFLVVVGLMIAAIGVLIWAGSGRGWFGQLPGDLHVERWNFKFYLPIATCLLISIILSLVLWLFRK